MVTSNTNPKTKRDSYNLRLLDGLSSANHFGLPILKGYDPEHTSTPIPFHEARTLWKKSKKLNGYFIHFYTEDYRFECIRKYPERYLPMLKSADYVIAPDFSTYRNFPFPVLLKNLYDNQVLAAYFEKNGIKVVPNVVWSSPMFYDVTFSGQPSNCTIFVNSKSLSTKDKKGLGCWLHGYKEAVNRLSPKKIFRIGKIVPGEEEIFSNPIRLEIENPYVKRMSHGR